MKDILLRSNELVDLSEGRCEDVCASRGSLSRGNATTFGLRDCQFGTPENGNWLNAVTEWFFSQISDSLGGNYLVCRVHTRHLIASLPPGVVRVP
jgi:hypothetical protein